MTSHSETPLAILEPARLIPLLTIERIEDAVPLARTLVEAGLPTLEIALRTKVAPNAIRQILRDVPGAVPGAGNVMTPHDLALARDTGARFALSPGSTPALLDAAAAQDLPFVPGIATASELMNVISAGFHVVKFFPGATLGGAATLRAMAAPFPRVKFCPTGGTSEDDLEEWLAQPNVIAVGGAWLAPIDEIRQQQWDRIGARARAAVQKYLARRVPNTAA
jgi:2-dehydro-3-deoxyphosphogluconate aldolase/(4S)-4-hydroxy-2-oxoglutarate aldolase